MQTQDRYTRSLWIPTAGPEDTEGQTKPTTYTSQRADKQKEGVRKWNEVRTMCFLASAEFIMAARAALPLDFLLNHHS